MTTLTKGTSFSNTKQTLKILEEMDRQIELLESKSFLRQNNVLQRKRFNISCHAAKFIIQTKQIVEYINKIGVMGRTLSCGFLRILKEA